MLHIICFSTFLLPDKNDGSFHYTNLQPKSVLKSRKSEFDGYFDDDCDDDDTPVQGFSENSSQPINSESAVDNLVSIFTLPYFLLHKKTNPT